MRSGRCCVQTAEFAERVNRLKQRLSLDALDGVRSLFHQACSKLPEASRTDSSGRSTKNDGPVARL